MTEKVVITANKDITITQAEGKIIAAEMLQAFRDAQKAVGERWGVTITLEEII